MSPVTHSYVLIYTIRSPHVPPHDPLPHSPPPHQFVVHILYVRVRYACVLPHVLRGHLFRQARDGIINLDRLCARTRAFGGRAVGMNGMNTRGACATGLLSTHFWAYASRKGLGNTHASTIWLATHVFRSGIRSGCVCVWVCGAWTS